MFYLTQSCIRVCHSSKNVFVTYNSLGMCAKVHTTSPDNRYYADKIAQGPLLRFHGKNMKEKIHNKGMLPHDPDAKERLPVPQYKPKNAWNEKRALFGQNDYIDILGDISLHPTETLYEVPKWLRGFKGNEYQMLLRQKKLFGQSLAEHEPHRFDDLEKRIRYLYKRLNFTKSWDPFWK